MRKIDLMIVGAQKAGTTALKNYLNEHPKVLGHPQTEFAYFSDNDLYERDFDKVFKEHFLVGNSKTAQVIIAKNVTICSSKISLERLRDHNPDCKIVFVVREPVSRAYSSYTMEVFNGWLTREFSCIETVIDNKDYDNVMYKLFVLSRIVCRAPYSYLSNSSQGPKLKFFCLKILKSNPEQVCLNLFEWLEIDTAFVPNTNIVYNESQRPQSAVFSRILMRLKRKDNLVKRALKAMLPYYVFTRIGNYLTKANKSSSKAQPAPTETLAFLHRYFEPYNKKA